MKELVVISGKGGTGKTSLVASFAALSDQTVLADCDVDAADLHLVLEPTIFHREDYSGGCRARVNPEQCVGCGKCPLHWQVNGQWRLSKHLQRWGQTVTGFPVASTRRIGRKALLLQMLLPILLRLLLRGSARRLCG